MAYAPGTTTTCLLMRTPYSALFQTARHSQLPGSPWWLMQGTNWDDKVIDYIPEFRMYDPLCNECTHHKHLLTHRSGFGLGARPSCSSPTETNLPSGNHQQYPLPEKYRSSEQNTTMTINPYIVAGEALARVSGKTWEDLLNIASWNRLDLSAGFVGRVKNNPNIIDAHVPINGKVQYGSPTGLKMPMQPEVSWATSLISANGHTADEQW